MLLFSCLCHFLITEAILTDLFLFNSEITKCEDHFDINLAKIQ